MPTRVVHRSMRSYQASGPWILPSLSIKGFAILRRIRGGSSNETDYQHERRLSRRQRGVLRSSDDPGHRGPALPDEPWQGLSIGRTVVGTASGGPRNLRPWLRRDTPRPSAQCEKRLDL